MYGACDTTKASLLKNLPVHYVRSFREALRFDPDVVFGMGAYAAHTGAITGARTILVLDSEATTLDHRISRPFADALVTPESFRADLGADHYRFPGFKECAYLHPEVFEPDPSVREELGVGDEPFAILRLNAFGSHHDVAQGGFTTEQVATLVEDLAAEGTVLISDEGGDLDVEALPAQRFDLHPARLHDALAAASLLVADTQTMVTEAALLGTPAVRSNSFVGEDDMGNFLDLAERDLIRNLAAFEDVRATAVELLADPDATARWERRRAALLEDVVNLTDLLVTIAEQPRDLDRIPALLDERAPPVPTP